MAHLADGGPFHLDRQHLREVGARLGDGVRLAHKLITGADEADLGLMLALLGDAALGKRDQLLVTGEGGGLLRHLAHLVAEGGHVHVVEAHLAGDHHVTYVQVLGETAGGAGVDDAIRGKLLQQQAGGDAGGDLADAGAGQDHLFTGQPALIELAAAQLQGGQVAQLAAQQGHFLLHGADNTYFHPLPRLYGPWAE
ncbi:hypothetical protein D3C84_504970 [compost metagenome]